MNDITQRAERARAYLSDEFFREDILGSIRTRLVTTLCETDPSDKDGLVMARLRLDAIDQVVVELQSMVNDHTMQERRERHHG